MLKHKILGILNIPICIFFIISLFALIYDHFENRYSVNIGEILVIIFILVLLLWHAFISYRLLFEDYRKMTFFLYLLLSFCPIFYITLLFAGYYLATSLVFQLCFLALIIIIYYSFKKYSKILALLLSILAFLTLLLSFIGGFKEDYCWEKGEQADRSGSAMVIATKEDAELLKGFGVGKEGSRVGVRFLNHIRCEKTFNFSEALKDNYSFLK